MNIFLKITATAFAVALSAPVLAAVDQEPVASHPKFECIGALDRSDHCFDEDGNPRQPDVNAYGGLISAGDEAEVYNGTRSVDGEFGPLAWIGNCTGTLVSEGRNVVFTASHCVYNGKRISYEHRESGRSYAGTCTRHPRYNDRTVYNDYALCKLDSPVPAASKVASFAAQTPANGTQLLMNGFGAPNVGTHYWGKANVSSTSGQDIITNGPSNLGGGDSGGPLFLWSDDRVAGPFVIVGVNSRAGGGRSYFNRTSHEEWGNFAAQYEQSQGVRLCGIAATCSGGGNPDPDPNPPDCAAEANAAQQTLAAHVQASNALQSCLRQ